MGLLVHEPLLPIGDYAFEDPYGGLDGLSELVARHNPKFHRLRLRRAKLDYPVVVVEMMFIAREDRGQGRGEAFLSELCAWADKHAVRLALSPSSAHGGKIRRLKAWYTRHGFQPNKGREANCEIMESYVRLPFYLTGGRRKGYSNFGLPSKPAYFNEVLEEIEQARNEKRPYTTFREFKCWQERSGAMVCTCGQPSELVTYSTLLSGRCVRCRACHERTC